MRFTSRRSPDDSWGTSDRVPERMDSATKLSELATGATAKITGISSDAPGLLRLREMGVLPGTSITLVRRAPLGDPIEISVRGSLLSVRREEAEHIDVNPDSD